MEFPVLLKGLADAIQCMEMHTCGEPARIIYKGFPATTGSLLEQRSQAKSQYDHVRRRLMLEPRGHNDMYGAILRQTTELTENGKAHIGVLFCHNDGFSTMCGHATIALGRFLVDCHDESIFPKREELVYDSETGTVQINLHAPCGLVQVTVPTSDDGQCSDSTRPVSFISVPSFAPAIDLIVLIPSHLRWPQLDALKSDEVKVDVAYGGAFYCLVESTALGFHENLLSPSHSGIPTNITELDYATKRLKQAMNENEKIRQYLVHPDSKDLGFLYSVLITENDGAPQDQKFQGSEIGLCFFADQQVDRSPTGSAVSARVALAFTKQSRKLGEAWTYHSIISNHFAKDYFVGTPVKALSLTLASGVSTNAVQVKVEGFAYYTGHGTYMVESSDTISEQGFSFKEIVKGNRE